MFFQAPHTYCCKGDLPATSFRRLTSVEASITPLYGIIFIRIDQAILALI